MRRIALLFGLLIGLTAGAEPAARVAIIIDDLGNSLALGRQAVALPGNLTYAVLPRLAHSRELAETAHAAGKEVMLHLPMQAEDGRALGPGALQSDMGRFAFVRRLRDGIAAVPHVVGVNNHMGSLLTRDAQAMRWLMQDLRCIGGLYFVDSRTHVLTRAESAARAAGVPSARRDVFLDHQVDPAAIRAQLERLERRALRHGSAIGIGHPYPQTLEVLAEWLPGLPGLGIELVPASRLVTIERSNPSWHASSSPSLTAAKNSKPSPSSTCCAAPASTW